MAIQGSGVDGIDSLIDYHARPASTTRDVSVG